MFLGICIGLIFTTYNILHNVRFCKFVFQYATMQRTILAFFLITFSVALFMLLGPAQLVPDRDEMHSILSAHAVVGKRNIAFNGICDTLIPAEKWQEAIRANPTFSPKIVMKHQLMYDIHPPLYFMILHTVYLIIDDYLIGGYLLQLVLLVCFIVLIKSWQKKNIFQLLILLGLLPGLFIPFAEIRHYGLLLIWAVLSLWMIHKLELKWTINAFSVFLISGVGGMLTHFLFFPWMVSLLIATCLFWKNKKQAFILVAGWISILIALWILIPSLSYQIGQLITSSKPDFSSFSSRLTNLIFGITGLFFPVWSFKLLAWKFLPWVLLIPAIIWTFYCMYYFFLCFSKHKISLFTSVLFLTLYSFLFSAGKLPIHASGVKYLSLACVGMIPVMFDYLSKISRSAIYASLWWVICWSGEYSIRLRERRMLYEILQPEYSFYASRADVFSTLRFIISMDPNKKIYVKSKPNDDIKLATFDQIWQVWDDTIQNNINSTHEAFPMRVRGFVVEGILFLKK